MARSGKLLDVSILRSHPQAVQVFKLCEQVWSGPLLCAMQDQVEGRSPVVQQLLQEQVGELLGQNSLDQFCRRYCKRHAGTSLLHAAAAAQGLVLLDVGAAAEAAALITDFDISQGTVPALHMCLLAVPLGVTGSLAS